MRPISQTISALGATAPVILDQYLNPTDTLLAVEFTTGGVLAVGTVTVQYTPDPIYNADGSLNTGATYYNHPVLVNLVADAVDQLDVPASAVRLNVTAYTSGTFTFRVRQAGATG